MTNKSQYSDSRLTPCIIWILLVCGWSFHYAGGMCYASEDLYEARLNKGLHNTEPYSYLLMERAAAEKARSAELLEKAKKYSPDLPAVYFKLAGNSISLSPKGIFKAINYSGQGLNAYQRSFWWGFSFIGTASVSLLISYILSMLLVIVIRFPVEPQLLLHDIIEDRRRAVVILMLLFLSFFGIFAFIACAFLFMALYFKKADKILFYAALLVFLLSPWALKAVDKFISGASPELRAIVDVNEGRDNRYAVAVLKDREDFLSRFSYAIALKREGDYNEAVNIYKNLAAHSKASPRVHINLGNAYYGAGNAAAAKEAYRASISIKPLPSAYYNLSQVSRETLDFVRGEEYFLEAARLNPEAISGFASVAGSNPNRFVADEPLPSSVIWGYAASLSDRGFSNVGMGKVSVLIAVGLLPLFFLINKKLRHRARMCKRCGAIFCNKCSRTIVRGDMCSRCYASFVRMGGLNLQERVSILMSAQQRQDVRRRTAKVLSCIIPGAGHVYSGKVLQGLLFLWLFLFLVTMLLLASRSFLMPFPFTHGWIALPVLACAGILYVVSFLHMRRGINKGWL